MSNCSIRRSEQPEILAEINKWRLSIIMNKHALYASRFTLHMHEDEGLGNTAREVPSQTYNSNVELIIIFILFLLLFYFWAVWRESALVMFESLQEIISPKNRNNSNEKRNSHKNNTAFCKVTDVSVYHTACCINEKSTFLYNVSTFLPGYISLRHRINKNEAQRNEDCYIHPHICKSHFYHYITYFS